MTADHGIVAIDDNRLRKPEELEALMRPFKPFSVMRRGFFSYAFSSQSLRDSTDHLITMTSVGWRCPRQELHLRAAAQESESAPC